MGSPELTKMADFVGAGRVPRDRRSDRGHGCGCDPGSGWPGPGPRLERPRTGAGVAAPRRRDTAAAIAGTRS